jgi:hypothetical protein
MNDLQRDAEQHAGRIMEQTVERLEADLDDADQWTLSKAITKAVLTGVRLGIVETVAEANAHGIELHPHMSESIVNPDIVDDLEHPDT